MSHFTRVRTQIRERRFLLDALREMGETVVERGKVRGWRGQVEEADVVVRRANGYDIGFIAVGDEAYEIVADWMGVDETRPAFSARVAREYATAAAMERAQKAGWKKVRRETQGDGSVLVTGVMV